MEGIIVIVLGAVGYLIYKFNVSRKLSKLQSKEGEIEKAIADLEKGIEVMKQKQKGKSNDEIEDYWNNN